MQHLDVAGGTGDVAFRVLRAIRAAEALSASQPDAPPPGRVVCCDINPQMLAEGRKKAMAAPDLTGGCEAMRGGDVM
jgi:2-methoxy-6-polyprenyl-1,4-benzoquinol methylase